MSNILLFTCIDGICFSKPPPLLHFAQHRLRARWSLRGRAICMALLVTQPCAYSAQFECDASAGAVTVARLLRNKKNTEKNRAARTLDVLHSLIDREAGLGCVKP
jgi:hypothetical protein